jgi:hypothetical protein
MDGLGPSTLYAQTAHAHLASTTAAGIGVGPRAQFSLDAILCHYRRQRTGEDILKITVGAPGMPGCPLFVCKLSGRYLQ